MKEPIRGGRGRDVVQWNCIVFFDQSTNFLTSCQTNRRDSGAACYHGDLQVPQASLSGAGYTVAIAITTLTMTTESISISPSLRV